MVLYNNYDVESLQYTLYECNKYIDDIVTKLKINEAEILYRAKEALNESEIVLENEFFDKIKTEILGAPKTGRYDLIRPALLKNVNDLQTVDQVDHVKNATIKYSIPTLKENLKYEKKYPEQFKQHIEWLGNEFIDALDQRKKEIQHSVVETGMDFDEYQEYFTEGEIGDKVMSHIPGGTKHTGRYDLLRPILLKKAKTAKDLERIKYLRSDLQNRYKTLENYKKLYPQHKQQIEDHIKWCREVYTQALNDRAKELRNYIKESALEEISLIQESAIDNIVKAIQWLIDKVRELWNKFMGNKVSNDEKNKWLLENKDKILNNAYKGEKEMPKFWEHDKVSEIASKTPKFDYKTMKPNLGSDESFINTYFQDLYKDGKPYMDVLKTILYGENAVVKDNNMPIKIMFDYCTKQWDQKVKNIEKLHNMYISAAESFSNDIKSGKVSVEESNVIFERYFYSYLLETVVYEGDMSSDTGKDQNNQQQNNQNNTQNNNNQNTNNTQTNTQQDQAKSAEAKNKEQSAKAMEAQKHISRYITICTNIKGILMKCIEDTYDTYYSILEKHAITNGATKVKSNKKKDNNQDNNQQTK